MDDDSNSEWRFCACCSCTIFQFRLLCGSCVRHTTCSSPPKQQQQKSKEQQRLVHCPGMLSLSYQVLQWASNSSKFINICEHCTHTEIKIHVVYSAVEKKSKQITIKTMKTYTSSVGSNTSFLTQSTALHLQPHLFASDILLFSLPSFNSEKSIVRGLLAFPLKYTLCVTRHCWY